MNVILSLNYYIPELLVTGLALLAVVMDLIWRKDRGFRQTNILIFGLAVTILYLLLSPSDGQSLFFGTVVQDSFGRFFKIIASAAGIFTLWSLRYSNVMKKYNHGEFNSLLLMIILGVFVLSSATDLILIYLSFELLSLLSYVLTAYLLKDPKSNEAGLKYIIYGAFSSGLMLFGMSWLYGLTGSLKIDGIHFYLNSYVSTPLPVYIALLLILAGIGYKIAAVPFHFWSPDVYEGAPTPFTAFLSVAPKAAGLAVLIRMFSYTFSSTDAFVSESWSPLAYLDWPMLIAVISAVTMTLGNTVALQQTNVKRLLAYSSIAHAGYMLMGLVVLNHEGIFAILFYIGVYMFMNLGAFFVAVFVANQMGREDISDFRGLGYKAPLIGILMSLFLFSLTGLPPTAGFIGKFYLFAALIKSQSQWLWLAVIGILNSVVSLYYYVGIIREMYMQGNEAEDNAAFDIQPGFALMLVLLAVPVLLFGIYWTPLQSIAAESLQLMLSL